VSVSTILYVFRQEILKHGTATRFLLSRALL
jgi:hypothetical protein